MSKSHYEKSVMHFCSICYQISENKGMKRFTLVALATLIGATSVVTFSSSVKAETREEFCRYHDCGREYRYERERERARYEREREHARDQQHRWYDSRTGEWRDGYR